VAAETREIIETEVSAAPGLPLSDLLRNTQGIASRDDVHRLIAAGNIYVDLRATGIMEPDKARVFPNRETALTSRHIEGQQCSATSLAAASTLDVTVPAGRPFSIGATWPSFTKASSVSSGISETAPSSPRRVMVLPPELTIVDVLPSQVMDAPGAKGC